jgi:hypothetical protein
MNSTCAYMEHSRTTRDGKNMEESCSDTTDDLVTMPRA